MEEVKKSVDAKELVNKKMMEMAAKLGMQVTFVNKNESTAGKNFEFCGTDNSISEDQIRHMRRMAEMV